MALAPLSSPKRYNIDMSSRVLLELIYITRLLQAQSSLDPEKNIAYQVLHLSTKKSHARSLSDKN